MGAPKTLGFGDLLFYAASMTLSIRWISVAAAAGPASLPIWALAVLVFSGPLIVATAELTTRFEGEGGVYAWTRRTFGPFWGFLCGWLYWSCNLPYFAGILVFQVALCAAALGPVGQRWLADPMIVTSLAVALCLFVAALHYWGLGSGKWLSNVGASSSFALIVFLIVVGLAASLRLGPATDFVHASYAPPWSADGAILWATMVFGVGGTEGLALLRNDVRGGLRTILRVLAVMAFIQVAFYVAGTAAMLGILSPENASRLSGLADALNLGMERIGLGPLAPVPLLFAFLFTLGGYSAWFGAAARLPFAAGIDEFLPAQFARRDPRTGAPVVAIAVQTAIVIAIVVLSQAGDTLRGAYDFLVAMSVLSYTLPFVFLFVVFLALQYRRTPLPHGAWQTPGGAAAGKAVGFVGLGSTLVAIACTMVPSPDAADPLGATLKLAFASLLLIFGGIAFYALARRRTRRASRPHLPPAGDRG
jgi:amino acid transporter